MEKERKYCHNIAAQKVFVSSSLFRMLSILFFYSCVQYNTYGQDIRFSQFHASSTFLNPAFAGSGEGPRIILNFRDQWPDIPQTYVTYRASFDTRLDAIHSGIGFYALQSNEGNAVLKTSGGGVQYMYQAKLGNSIALNTGIQCSYFQKQLDWQKLQFYDQISPIFGFNDAAGLPNVSSEPAPPSLATKYVDIGAGMVLIAKNFFFGISANHLTQPQQSFYNNSDSKLPLNVTSEIGIEWKTGNNKYPFYISPVAVFTTQNDFNQLMAGCYFRKNIFLTGIFIKHNFSYLSDMALLVGITKGQIGFAYNYDVGIGALAGKSGGAHEVSLTYLFKEGTHKMTTKRQKDLLDCPTIL